MSQRYFAAALVLALASGAGAAQAPTGLVPIRQVAPQYPYKAARAGISGWVDVLIVVERDGSVRTAQVVAGQPQGVFDNAALNAVVLWKFRPQPVETEVIQRFGFQLPAPPPAVTPEAVPEAAPESVPEAAPEAPEPTS